MIWRVEYASVQCLDTLSRSKLELCLLSCRPAGQSILVIDSAPTPAFAALFLVNQTPMNYSITLEIQKGMKIKGEHAGGKNTCWVLPAQLSVESKSMRDAWLNLEPAWLLHPPHDLGWHQGRAQGCFRWEVPITHMSQSYLGSRDARWGPRRLHNLFFKD